MDPRLYSLSILPTAPKLLAGEMEGLLRFPFLANLLGVPMADRGALGDWIEANDLWFEEPYHCLAARPNAGTMRVEDVRQALLVGIKAGTLPFRCEQLEGRS